VNLMESFETYDQDMNNFQVTEAAGDKETHFACGIDWCREYISLTTALNDYIEQGDLVNMDSLLEQRRGLLEHLPDVVKTESEKEINETFVEMLGTIKDLEHKGKYTLESRMSDVVKDVGGIQKFRRANAYTKENNVVSRFVDKKS
jgi:hypothetical protein